MAAVLPTSPSNAAMSGLARALMQAGRLTAQQADAIQKKAAVDKTQFIDALLLSGGIDARSLAAFCAETFGYPMVDLAAINFTSLPEKVIDAKLMQSQRVVALAKRGNKMSVILRPHFATLQSVFISGLNDQQSNRVRIAALK